MLHKTLLVFSLFLYLSFELHAWMAAPANPSGSPADALGRDFVNIEGMTDLEALLTREEGWFWLRTDFQAIDGADAFLLHGTSLGWTAWLNGEKVANSGSGPPLWYLSSGVPVLVRIPEKSGTENEILLKVYIRRGYTKAPSPPEFGKSDRLEQHHRLLTLMMRGIPAISFILGMLVLLIFLAGGKGRRGRAQSAFGLFGFFMALISLETVLSAIPGLPLYVPWIPISLAVRISLPFTLIFWRRTISMTGGKDSPALIVLDLLLATLTAFWISAPLSGYPLIPQQFRGYFGFDPMPGFLLYTFATALAIWLYHSTRSHPGRVGTLLVFLLGIAPSLILFALHRSGETMFDGFQRYGLPLSLVAVFALQIRMRGVVSERHEAEKDDGDIESLIPFDDEDETLLEKPETRVSDSRQTGLARRIRSTLYPLSIPWDPEWDVASVHQGSVFPATGFHDLYLNSSGQLEGFSFMDCGDESLEGLLFTRLVQREFRKCYKSGKTLPGTVRTTNRKSLQAAELAGTTMRGIAGRFEKDNLTFISLTAQHLLLRRDNGRKVVHLGDGSGGNPALGSRMSGSEVLKTTKVPMSKNDMMLFFTPGIIGLESPSGDSLGIERLGATLSGSAGRRADLILADIAGELKNFFGQDVLPFPLQMLLLRRR